MSAKNKEAAASPPKVAAKRPSRISKAWKSILGFFLGFGQYLLSSYGPALAGALIETAKTGVMAVDNMTYPDGTPLSGGDKRRFVVNMIRSRAMQEGKTILEFEANKLCEDAFEQVFGALKRQIAARRIEQSDPLDSQPPTG